MFSTVKRKKPFISFLTKAIYATSGLDSKPEVPLLLSESSKVSDGMGPYYFTVSNPVNLGDKTTLAPFRAFYQSTLWAFFSGKNRSPAHKAQSADKASKVLSLCSNVLFFIELLSNSNNMLLHNAKS
jgi:hypothetical protein